MTDDFRIGDVVKFDGHSTEWTILSIDDSGVILIYKGTHVFIDRSHFDALDITLVSRLFKKTKMFKGFKKKEKK